LKLTHNELKLIATMLMIGNEHEALLDAFGDDDAAMDAVERLEFCGLICGDSGSRQFFTLPGYDWLVENGHIEPSLFSKTLLTQAAPYRWHFKMNRFEYQATDNKARHEST